MDKDKEFEPSIDMMIHDFDDEQTLEEEERQAAAEANADDELNDLQREGDMPLEQLLAMYYSQPPASMDTDEDDEADTSTAKSKADSDAEDESDLKNLYPVGVNSLSAILAAAEESDVDYEPDESDNRKKIMVGSEHQAAIPEMTAQDEAQSSDQLIWSPDTLAEDVVIDYLQQIKALHPPRLAPDASNTWTVGDSGTGNTSRHVRDDEKSLSVLRETAFDVAAALERAKSDVARTEQTCWSEEECLAFEAGLLAHGKNFHEIHATKVGAKSVGEIIQFYYHWKKSERYDAFVSKNNRFDKKKYNANSGPCIMDRFLDDQEGTGVTGTGTNGMHLRDRTTLTVNNSLLSADAKRRHDKQETTTAATSSLQDDSPQ